MTDFQRGIVTLMKSAVTGEAAVLPEGFSIEEAEKFAAKQNITPLVFAGAVNCGISKGEPAMQRMFQKYIQQLMISERQMAAVEKLFQAFEENGIDYLPLKGVNMKKLYPKPELRTMGDADILIREEQYEKIRLIMPELGFTEGMESDHEHVWDGPGLHLELHKKLIPTEQKDLYRHFGSGWQLAVPMEGHRFRFRAEDDFLYQFTHFVKHYRGAGIGTRHVLDLWVYLKSHPGLDADYLEHGLEKLHLLEFYRNIQALHQNWFADAPGNDKTEFITRFLFSGGTWGSMDTFALSLVARKKGSGKVATVLARVFLPLEAMQLKYPFLKKAPILLPVFWIIRIFDAFLFKRYLVRKARRIMKVADEEKVDAYHQSLQYVGLDFHFD